ncbi:hypothetical protein G9A89_007643 [Geosiphon pyriformis]|nr:hypothetical protein G9A89_007643 [Geosiphon pyriformis]
MGRKDFVQDVKKLKEYFSRLSAKSTALVKGFDFQDPELSFRFTYKSRKAFTVQIFVNDTSLRSYPSKFSGFVCVDGSVDNETNSAAKLLEKANIANQTVGEIMATIIHMLCNHFRIQIPKDLNANALREHGGSTTNALLKIIAPENPIVKTPSMLLERDLLEIKHWKYHGELLCADEIGYKVSVSMPVSRLGLSFEACEAWNLDPNRYLVCTIQFSPSYIDLEGVVAQACQKKSDLMIKGGCAAVKEWLKKQFPIEYTILTSALPRGVPSHAHHKDDFLESDHFVLSWTLTELLRSKFFDMLCDYMWFGIGWDGAEFADLKRHKEKEPNFLNGENPAFQSQIEKCILQDKVQHGQLCYLEAEKNEISSASKNHNFLLVLLRFLRRRILLSTKYCLTCHYPHDGAISSIRPFVCNAALCEHQAQSKNLSPYPSRAIGVTTTAKHEGNNSLVVDWSDTHGTIGVASQKSGYEVYGWKPFEDLVKVNDMLEVYNPETGQSFTVNRCNQTTSVRVLEVTTAYLITDFPIIFPVSAVPSRPVYLPFRLCRRTECNFLGNDDHVNYLLIQAVINRLPSVSAMVQYAQKKILKAELDKLDPLCFPLLSWIISSNRTHLRLLESEEEKVQFNEESSYGNWRQFVMIMSSPDKESNFQKAKEELRIERMGQPLGELTCLNWKKIVHGRAFGDGVYHSLQAGTSATYAGAAYPRKDTGVWKNSMLVVTKCMALSEIVNRPSRFISTNPYLVVSDESWITTRYLFVECLRNPTDPVSDSYEDEWSPGFVPSLQYAQPIPVRNNAKSPAMNPFIRRQSSSRGRTPEFIKLDPAYTPVWLNNSPLQIPKRDFLIIANEAPQESSVKVEPFNYQFSHHSKSSLVVGRDFSANRSILDDEILDEAADDEDEDEDEIEIGHQYKGKGKGRADQDSDGEDEDEEEMDDEQDDDYSEDYLIDDDDAFGFPPSEPKKPEDEPDFNDGQGFDPNLLPAPDASSKTATHRISQELCQIVRKQTNPSNDLAFSVNTDKLKSMYQWVVQMKDFDPSLPLAQDMKKYKVKSIDMEVRFSPEYPYHPPYIRVIRPRLLRFMEGGGGHVTAGGSICMDLLTLGSSTENGWSSVYNMEAVLLQVKMALCSLDPNPARLDSRFWNSEYDPSEAMDAYIRVANQHGWRIPPEWSKLFGR